MAEIEPKFFKPNFRDIFELLSAVIVAPKEDFAKQSIRHQPIEFFVTIASSLPGIFKKNSDLL